MFVMVIWMILDLYLCSVWSGIQGRCYIVRNLGWRHIPGHRDVVSHGKAVSLNEIPQRGHSIIYPKYYFSTIRMPKKGIKIAAIASILAGLIIMGLYSWRMSDLVKAMEPLNGKCKLTVGNGTINICEYTSHTLY